MSGTLQWTPQSAQGFSQSCSEQTRIEAPKPSPAQPILTISMNGYEVHLPPGKGNIDFGNMFRLIEGAGFKGGYTNAFGTLDDMLAARDIFVNHARAAGVKV